MTSCAIQAAFMGNKTLPLRPLSNVLRLKPPGVAVDANETYAFAGVRSFGGGVFVAAEKLGATFSYKKLSQVSHGDFVYPKLMAWEGALGVVPHACDGLMVSPEFCVFDIDRSHVLPEWLAYYFQQPSVWPKLAGGSAGTNVRRRRIYPADFLKFKIPLPDLARQEAIVRRISALQAKLREAQRFQTRAREATAALLPSVLNEYFGDVYRGLPGRLEAEVRRLGDVVTDVADGPHVTPQYQEDGIPFVTVLNITSGRVEFAGAKFISEEDHRLYMRRARAEPGDVLLSKDGTIGVPCFVDRSEPFSYFVSVALIKPIRDVLDGECLTWVLRCPAQQGRMVERSRGDMIRHLVLREIRDLQVPVPSVAEQHDLVRRFRALGEKLGTLRSEQTAIDEHLRAASRSVLDAAFGGSL
jgi:restriction endonuclease S subunit